MTWATAGGLDLLCGSRDREIFFNTQQNGNSGDHAVVSAAATGGVGRIEFTAPADLSVVVALELIVIPGNTSAAANFDLDSDYAAVGQAKTTHSESDTTTTYDITTDELFAIDLTGVFALLAAGDACGVKLTNNEASAVQVLGVRLRYR